MKTFLSILTASLIGITPALALEPIPGSITYGGQPANRLQKAPVGSPVTHEFFYRGDRYKEVYVIQADRSLKLISRGQYNND